jgi:hypothetical protein
MIDHAKDQRVLRLESSSPYLWKKVPLPRAWQLHFELQRIDKLYTCLVANAVESDRERLDAEWALERLRVDEEQQGIVTERLRRNATRLLIPLPVISSENWERGAQTGIWHLTSEGAAKVRRALHEERKRRQEIWLPWLAVVVGLIGASIGLVVALKEG